MWAADMVIWDSYSFKQEFVCRLYKKLFGYRKILGENSSCRENGGTARGRDEQMFMTAATRSDDVGLRRAPNAVGLGGLRRRARDERGLDNGLNFSGVDGKLGVIRRSEGLNYVGLWE